MHQARPIDGLSGDGELGSPGLPKSAPSGIVGRAVLTRLGLGCSLSRSSRRCWPGYQGPLGYGAHGRACRPAPSCRCAGHRGGWNARCRSAASRQAVRARPGPDGDVDARPVRRTGMEHGSARHDRVPRRVRARALARRRAQRQQAQAGHSLAVGDAGPSGERLTGSGGARRVGQGDRRLLAGSGEDRERQKDRRSGGGQGASRRRRTTCTRLTARRSW